MEIWKSFIINDLVYEISSLGNIRSLGSKFHKGKTLKPYKAKNGYLAITLTSKHVHKYIHRLVAEAFIPNPNNYNEINHINEDKTDNRVENLEWCTHNYNYNYGSRIEKVRQKRIGKYNTKSSKKIAQYDLDGNLIKIFESGMEAKRNGYNNTHISLCCRGLRKTACGYMWNFIQ